MKQKKQRKSVRVMMRTTPDVRQELERRAAEMNRTMSNYLELLVIRDLERARLTETQAA